VLFSWLTGQPPLAGGTLAQPVSASFGGTLVWDDTLAIMSDQSTVYPQGGALIGLTTYGRNGGDGRPATYLMTGGPGGETLFDCAPGAVFTSLESYNALTMFVDVPTNQAKIAEFIQMGGSAAIGHAFEPAQDAIVQVEYLFGNLLRDDDGDGVGDMCLAEAAFSAMPYLSWSEVLIGDPLMRYRSGPGGEINTHDSCPTDLDGDGVTGFGDYLIIYAAFNAKLGSPKYNPASDVNRDGFVNFIDVSRWYDSFNTYCPN
jgi:hypothetical protein